ncbi:hypothetical protein E2C01_046635 [Portunus trituberculatus]|uniref:Uncharacterized protein n=1 Tax=Portunus trituberculatus TaxID=210409 RepID=A0A5B7G5C1_PORTR|nr:hypothetical protein [Portunus trituberculatus]
MKRLKYEYATDKLANNFWSHLMIIFSVEEKAHLNNQGAKLKNKETKKNSGIGFLEGEKHIAIARRQRRPTATRDYLHPTIPEDLTTPSVRSITLSPDFYRYTRIYPNSKYLLLNSLHLIPVTHSTPKPANPSTHPLSPTTRSRLYISSSMVHKKIFIQSQSSIKATISLVPTPFSPSI